VSGTGFRCKSGDGPLTRSLCQTPKGPLVLLFYDGFEWRARPGRIAGALGSVEI
jgi:hypothetical protein